MNTLCKVIFYSTNALNFFKPSSKIPTCMSKANSLKNCNICILPESKTWTRITVLKSGNCKKPKPHCLKYFVLTLCWLCIVVSVAFADSCNALQAMHHAWVLTEATLIEIGVHVYQKCFCRDKKLSCKMWIINLKYINVRC